MEDIREQMELGAEISAAISNPVAMGQEVGLTCSLAEDFFRITAACTECTLLSVCRTRTDYVL